MLCLLRSACWLLLNTCSIMNMNHLHKKWKALCWNVRGLNAFVTEFLKVVISFVYKKPKDSFDLVFIRKFCPRGFDAFEFLPSIGASRGLIIIWKTSQLNISLAFSNNFAISMDFHSNMINLNGCWLMFMAPVHLKESMISYTGWNTFRCQMIWIG